MAGRAEVGGRGHRGYRGYRILVIDDEDTIRDALVEIFGAHGYAAVGATDGRDGLRKLRAADGAFDLILLDLTMPLLDGRGFREEQRRDPALAAIPVIVLSAFHDVAVVAADLQAAAYLAKPLNLPVLLGIVGEHLPRR
jgi:DNA-binding response OmpR family regulator